MTYPTASPGRTTDFKEAVRRHKRNTNLVLTLIYVFAVIVFVLFMPGCQLIAPKIVTTEIERTEHGFRIVSPKDTTIKGLRLEGPNLSVDEYTAVASKEALEAGQNEANARAQAVGKLAEAAASLK